MKFYVCYPIWHFLTNIHHDMNLTIKLTFSSPYTWPLLWQEHLHFNILEVCDNYWGLSEYLWHTVAVESTKSSNLFILHNWGFIFSHHDFSLLPISQTGNPTPASVSLILWGLYRGRIMQSSFLYSWLILLCMALSSFICIVKINRIYLLLKLTNFSLHTNAHTHGHAALSLFSYHVMNTKQ